MSLTRINGLKKNANDKGYDDKHDNMHTKHKTEVIQTNSEIGRAHV